MIGKYLLDKSALARMIHAPVRRRLAPIIESGEAASCAIVDLEVLFSARTYEDYVETRRRRDLAYHRIPLKDETFQRALDVQQEQLVFPLAVAGDKGYDAAWIRQWLEDFEIESVIPQRSSGKGTPDRHFDQQAYRRRNVIERLIGWIKECRRIFSRFEKTATNFLAMIRLAFIQRYLKYIV